MSFGLLRLARLWPAFIQQHPRVELDVTLSDRIVDLEESVGFALFERMRGRLIPTSEAETLFEEVQQSLIGVDRIARTAQEIRHVQRGVLQVAAAPALALSFLPKVTAQFLRERPQAQITLLAESSRSVVDMVVTQRCDVGFEILTMNTPSTHGETLLSTNMVCAVPKGHRLAQREFVTPQDLKGEHFAFYPRLLDTRLQVDTVFAAHGVERMLRFETQLSQALCSFVESGLAVALVDAATASEFRGDKIRFLRFEPAVRMDFAVLTPIQRRPAMLAQAYVQYVREAALRQLDPRHVVSWPRRASSSRGSERAESSSTRGPRWAVAQVVLFLLGDGAGALLHSRADLNRGGLQAPQRFSLRRRSDAVEPEVMHAFAQHQQGGCKLATGGQLGDCDGRPQRARGEPLEQGFEGVERQQRLGLLQAGQRAHGSVVGHEGATIGLRHARGRQCVLDELDAPLEFHRGGRVVAQHVAREVADTHRERDGPIGEFEHRVAGVQAHADRRRACGAARARGFGRGRGSTISACVRSFREGIVRRRHVAPILPRLHAVVGRRPP